MAANVQEGDGVSPLRFSLAVSPTVFFCLLVVCCSWSVPGSTSPGASVQRLLTRAVECLALYVLTCATMCLAAGLPFTYFNCWTMFLGGTPYTDILQFCAPLLLAAPVLGGRQRAPWYLAAGRSLFCHPGGVPSDLADPAMQGFAGSGTLSAFVYGGAYTSHPWPWLRCLRHVAGARLAKPAGEGIPFVRSGLGAARRLPRYARGRRHLYHRRRPQPA